ncbi:MAG: hypothetical protein V7641_1446 [Blastocatellia bacterium]
MIQPSPHIADAVSSITEMHRHQLLEFLSTYANFEQANNEAAQLTGIQRFFPDDQSFTEFQRQLRRPIAVSTIANHREWGDFQTPSSLAARICEYLIASGVSPQIIIEPTYGLGRFIFAARKAFPTTKLIYGVEIQDKYEWNLKTALLLKSFDGLGASTEIELHRDDIFTHRFSGDLLKTQNLLIIGNPPWVTNTELSGLQSRNLPKKVNLKSLDGMDALTGKSNFDLGESILLRLLETFAGRHGTLALLCKNSVIKNFVELLPRRRFKVANIRALEIDAQREFGAAVDASLLVLETGTLKTSLTCKAGTLNRPQQFDRSLGWIKGRFVANIESYMAHAELDGQSPLVWRQGIKHDCARIMELSRQANLWINGNGEAVKVESEYVYPLLKSSDLRSFEISDARKRVIVTQQQLGEDTAKLERAAPALWQYLMRNAAAIAARKSIIYRGKPRFSIFGIGEYSFKPYKVAISGLYKSACFSIVLPMDNRPAMLDDTCYFLGFDNYRDALFTTALLNSSIVKDLLQAIVFADAKRPYTKEALMRIDLARAAALISFREIVNELQNRNYEPRRRISEADYEAYKQILSADHQNSQAQLSFI